MFLQSQLTLAQDRLDASDLTLHDPRAAGGGQLAHLLLEAQIEELLLVLLDLRAQLLANDRTGTPRAVAGVIWRKGIEHLLSRIDVPTLVLSGEEDVAVTPARSRRTAEAIRGARFRTIPSAGHSSSLENPEAVNDALRAFFAEVRGTARSRAL